MNQVQGEKMTIAKRIGLGLLFGGIVLTAGCTASLKSYPYSMAGTHTMLAPLQRDQYEILGDVDGRAEGTTILWFIHITEGGSKLFSGGFGGGIQGALMGGMNPIEQAALYNAMESQPDADGVIAVRVIKGDLFDCGVFKKESYEIKGKAIKIKKG